MRILRSAFLTAALAATLASGVARAQAIPFDLEAGYRFVSVTGNEEQYRSQINDREGFHPLLKMGPTKRAAPTDSSGPPTSAPQRQGSSPRRRPGRHRLRFSYRSTQFTAPSRASRTRSASRRSRPGPDARPVQRRSRDPSGHSVHAARRLPTTPCRPGTRPSLGKDEFQLSQNLRSHDQEFGRSAFRAGHLGRRSSRLAQTARRRDPDARSIQGTREAPNPSRRQDITATTLTRSELDGRLRQSAFVRAFALRLQLSGFYVGRTDRDDARKEGAWQLPPRSRFFAGYSAANAASPEPFARRHAGWHIHRRRRFGGPGAGLIVGQ